MAAYPNFPQLMGTKLPGDDGVQISRATSGRPRLRTRFSQVWHAGVIIHELDQTDVQTLLDFYNDNRMIPFIFTYALDGVDYTLQFSDYPQVIPKGGGYSDVTVSVVEV